MMYELNDGRHYNPSPPFNNLTTGRQTAYDDDNVVNGQVMRAGDAEMIGDIKKCTHFLFA